MVRKPTTCTVALVLFCSCVVAAQEAERAQQSQVATTQRLPFPKNFEAARYLGKWYEAARLPTPIQPEGTLATADYSKGEGDGEIVVKNTLYDDDGKQLSMVQGKGQLLPGDPPRMIVGFGPVRPQEPNYFVVHVDEDYQRAIVGKPDRKSLHILVRKVPVSRATLDGLIGIATKAGFETDKLVINHWKSPPATESDR